MRPMTTRVPGKVKPGWIHTQQGTVHGTIRSLLTTLQIELTEIISEDTHFILCTAFCYAYGPIHKSTVLYISPEMPGEPVSLSVAIFDQTKANSLMSRASCPLESVLVQFDCWMRFLTDASVL